MTTVEQVRKALEELRSIRARLMWEADYSIPCAIERALVTEGLKVCDRYEFEKHAADLHQIPEPPIHRLDLIASILRSAGRIS